MNETPFFPAPEGMSWGSFIQDDGELRFELVDVDADDCIEEC